MAQTFRYIDRVELEIDFYQEICARTRDFHPSQSLTVLDVMTDKKWAFLYNDKKDVGFAIPYNVKIPGVKQVYLPQFIQKILPLGGGEISGVLYQELLTKIKDDFKLGVYSLNYHEERFQSKKRVNYKIDLSKEYSDIRVAYRKRFRTLLNRSSDEVNINAEISSEEFMDFYKIQIADGRIDTEGFRKIEKLIKKSSQVSEECCVLLGIQMILL